MRRKMIVLLITFLWGGVFMLASEQTGQELHHEIEELVHEELEKDNFPGAVIYVGKGESTVFLEAYGHKTEENGKGEMTRDTIFDLASLTKPVATATAVLHLVEEGKIQLGAPVGRYLPEFAREGKEGVQVNHLLSHTSGLPAYMNAQNIKEKYGSPCPDELPEEIYALSLNNEPGEEMTYSCLGYIVLGELVKEVSGLDLAEYTDKHLWKPLQMIDTSFNPSSGSHDRIAPTQIIDGEPLVGLVHDPLARLMDGVSGNAGLFSTAEDLARYIRTIFNNGIYDNTPVLSESSVFFLTNEQIKGRSYGFDVRSSFSWIEGDHAPTQTFSHSGYTGTSLVIDPENELFIIILTNRPYPDDGGSVRRLRRETADIVFRKLLPQE